MGRWNRTKFISIDAQIHFGKHKGEKIIDVIKNDIQYIKWGLQEGAFSLNSQVLMDVYQKQIEKGEKDVANN